MFGLGYGEIAVIVLVGLVVFGPDKLPELAREAGRMMRTLRDLSSGARSQLRDELGPEFGDLDLRSFNPRTALSKALFDDEDPPTAGNRAVTGSTYAEDDKPVARPAQRPLARNEAAPYDDDAT